MALDILIDTNALLDIRSFLAAQAIGNTEYIQRTAKVIKSAYDLYEEARLRGDRLYVSDMTVVETKVTHIKQELFEYVRYARSMPVDSLYNRRTSILAQLRPDFNSTHLPNAVAAFNSGIMPTGLRILPTALSPNELEQWRKRKEILFQVLPEWEAFEAQDAYVIASAIAGKIDVIWTSDSHFRKAVNRLHDNRASFWSTLRASYPDIFTELIVPKAKSTWKKDDE